MERSTFRFNVVVFSLLIFLALTLCGCALIGRGGDEGARAVTVFGDQVALTGEATLVCSQECRERGFCGMTNSEERLVLLNSQTASSQIFDRYLPDNTPVSIIVVEQRVAYLRSNLQQLAINYYLVSHPNIGQGWVAGWCVGQ